MKLPPRLKSNADCVILLVNAPHADIGSLSTSLHLRHREVLMTLAEKEHAFCGLRFSPCKYKRRYDRQRLHNKLSNPDSNKYRSGSGSGCVSSTQGRLFPQLPLVSTYVFLGSYLDMAIR